MALSFVFVATWAVAQTDQRRSGYADMGAPVKKMQDDDSSNPAMLWVQEGEALWGKKTGTANLACADCHQPADQAAMKGVAARYPAWSPPLAQAVDLEGRIQLCRTLHQKGEPLAHEGRELLALTAFVAKQSRGLPVAPPDDRRLDATLKQGESLFHTRQGQLNLSCKQCHDDNAGQKLAAVTIPQAHPTGYPIYRLEWQSVGSLKRRLRNCLIGVRSEPYSYDASEYVALELYLAKRASGMKVEAPGVRP
ncbi:MAG TPA: sulfur oxidation c-type cytochrome SoxA [Reyranellaceae bacterium]|nr:sulfur oxidation c-type cytochrome SoxA [Reyranellaceae bacterium]